MRAKERRQEAREVREKREACGERKEEEDGEEDNSTM